MSQKMNGNSQHSLYLEYSKIAFAVALYWLCSISMIFLNKHLLSSPDLLAVPLFITWFQCLVSIALCFLLSMLSKASRGRVIFPEFHVDFQISAQMLSLSIFFVAMITFNNLCLKYVSVSFYFISRSLTTVFNVICTYLILGQKTSFSALFCCSVIFGGFFFGVDQEEVLGTLSVWGIAFGVLASLAVALNAIYTKKMLPMVAENIWRLTLYNNVNAFFLFIPLMVIFGEFQILYHLEHILSVKFWLLMCISGCFGFGMSYVTGLQIQVTSPLTHNISGTAKAAAQTVLATSLFHETKSFLWWLSNFVVLFGSAAYTYVKQQEMRHKIYNKKSVENEDGERNLQGVGIVDEKAPFLIDKV